MLTHTGIRESPGRAFGRLCLLAEKWLGDDDTALRAWDVACGDGGRVVAMARRGWQVRGSDPDPEAVWATRRWLDGVGHGETVQTEVAELGTDPWEPTARFEVVCWDGLHGESSHENATRVLRAAHRKLIPGGLLIVTLPSMGGDALAHLRAAQPVSEPFTRTSRFDEKAVRQMFAGFELVVVAEQVMNYLVQPPATPRASPFGESCWNVLARRTG